MKGKAGPFVTIKCWFCGRSNGPLFLLACLERLACHKCVKARGGITQASEAALEGAAR